jgi:hypothetical protein
MLVGIVVVHLLFVENRTVRVLGIVPGEMVGVDSKHLLLIGLRLQRSEWLIIFSFLNFLFF